MAGILVQQTTHIPVIVILSILAAVIPTIVYGSLIYWVDRYEKEPLWLLAAAFLWGAGPSVVAAFILDVGLRLPFYLLSQGFGDLAGAVLIAPLVEETLKGLALVGIFLFWRSELDSHLDGIIYGAMVGMGFGMVENVFYFLAVYQESGLVAWESSVLVRGVVFGLNHALFTSVTGLGLASARLSRRREVRLLAPLSGWAVAMLLHAIHNASATLGGPLVLLLFLSDFGGSGLTLLIIGWALWQERRWIRDYLADEVLLGTLTAGQLRRAASSWSRMGHSLLILLSQGPLAYWRSVRFYQHCAELAYKKHHFELFGDHRNEARAEALRAQIAGISRQLP